MPRGVEVLRRALGRRQGGGLRGGLEGGGRVAAGGYPVAWDQKFRGGGGAVVVRVITSDF